MNFVPAFPGVRLHFLLQFMNQFGQVVPPPIGAYSCKFYEVVGGAVAFEFTTGTNGGLIVRSNGIEFDKDMSAIPDLQVLTYVWEMEMPGPPVDWMANGEMIVDERGGVGSRFRTFAAYNGAIPQVVAPAFAPNLNDTAVTLEAGDLRYVRQTEVDTRITNIVTSALNALGIGSPGDLFEKITDTVAAMIVQGDNITTAFSDQNNTLTISSTGGGPIVTPPSPSITSVQITTGPTTPRPSFTVAYLDASSHVIDFQVADDVAYNTNLIAMTSTVSGAGNSVFTLTSDLTNNPARYARARINGGAWVALTGTTFAISVGSGAAPAIPTALWLSDVIANAPKFGSSFSDLVATDSPEIRISTSNSLPGGSTNIYSHALSAGEFNSGYVTGYAFPSFSNGDYVAWVRNVRGGVPGPWFPAGDGIPVRIDNQGELTVSITSIASVFAPTVNIAGTDGVPGQVVTVDLLKDYDDIAGTFSASATGTVTISATGAFSVNYTHGVNLASGNWTPRARRDLTFYIGPTKTLTLGATITGAIATPVGYVGANPHAQTMAISHPAAGRKVAYAVLLDRDGGTFQTVATTKDGVAATPIKQTALPNGTDYGAVFQFADASDTSIDISSVISTESDTSAYAHGYLVIEALNASDIAAADISFIPGLTWSGTLNAGEHMLFLVKSKNASAISWTTNASVVSLGGALANVQFVSGARLSGVTGAQTVTAVATGGTTSFMIAIKIKGA